MAAVVLGASSLAALRCLTRRRVPASEVFFKSFPLAAAAPVASCKPRALLASLGARGHLGRLCRAQVGLEARKAPAKRNRRGS